MLDNVLFWCYNEATEGLEALGVNTQTYGITKKVKDERIFKKERKDATFSSCQGAATLVI